MSAKASGADANGSAHKRDHHDGSSTRAFTVEQKAAVVRIKKCGATSFYDILGLEAERSTVTSGGIKKAYHRLSLLTHPDKNGYPGADEAFKMVSRAFQILSDPDKKSRYDQFGGDPDSRFGASAPQANPFAGFSRASAGMGGGMPRGAPFEAEISPEELFRQFFGGGGGGFGGFPFDGGAPGFVFSGPGGIRVHQFGGNRPRRRPAGAAGAGAAEEPPSAGAALMNLLPILLFFLLPLLTSMLSGWGSGPAFKAPAFSVDKPRGNLASSRVSKPLGVEYFFDAATTRGFEAAQWRSFDAAAERQLLGVLNGECSWEQQRRQNLIDAAHGWFSVDQDMLNKARNMDLAACARLQRLTKRGGGAGYF